MLRQPFVLGLQGRTATRKRAKEWSLTRRQVGPPFACEVRFHVAGTLDLNLPQDLNGDDFRINGPHGSLGGYEEFDHCETSSRRTGRIRLRRGRSTISPSKELCTAASWLASRCRVEELCRRT